MGAAVATVGAVATAGMAAMVATAAWTGEPAVERADVAEGVAVVAAGALAEVLVVTRAVKAAGMAAATSVAHWATVVVQAVLPVEAPSAAAAAAWVDGEALAAAWGA